MDDDSWFSAVDLVDDAVDAASDGARAGQLALYRTTEATRVAVECSKHELDDCRRGAFGEPVELSFGGPVTLRT